MASRAAISARSADRRAEAIRMRLAGATWLSIARRTGYSSGAAACTAVRLGIARAAARSDGIPDDFAVELGYRWRLLVKDLGDIDPVELLGATDHPLEVLEAAAVLARHVAALVEPGRWPARG